MFGLAGLPLQRDVNPFAGRLGLRGRSICRAFGPALFLKLHLAGIGFLNLADRLGCTVCQSDQCAAGDQHQKDKDQQDDRDSCANLTKTEQQRQTDDCADQPPGLDRDPLNDAFHQHFQQVVLDRFGHAHLENLKCTTEKSDQKGAKDRLHLERLVRGEQDRYVDQRGRDTDRTCAKQAEQGIVEPVPGARTFNQGERSKEDAGCKEDDRLHLMLCALLCGRTSAGRRFPAA